MNFEKGNCVEVLNTDNVLSRFPTLIGCHGVVDLAPIHPSTWFTIKMIDGRLIKLQNTAMKHLNKDSNRFQFQMEKNHSIANKAKHTINHHETSKENHRPRSNSMGIAQYTKGVSVVILGTENTIHRFPGMVGVVGVIHEVPVHPITWFKIEFPSGKIFTFRPSCFKLNDGTEEVKAAVKSPSAYSIHHIKKDKVFNKDKDQHIDIDFTIGMTVSIKSGDLMGEKGEVVRTSNGWIQVLTSVGKIAKRSHELECAKNDIIQYGIRPRSVSDVTSDSNDVSDSDTISPPKRMRHTKHHQKPKNTYLKRKYNDQTSEKPEMPFLYDLDRQAEGSPFPVIGLEIRQQKRIKLEKYLDCDMKGNEDHADRPDLSYW
eukprot:CAMPEP_0119037760 /NCGR_PEP_ID=MMETSP1177-20130426/6248_1 /TAXON_ID=2985 /ORGANISM="Ochromonas sp, Strain CCMP1899" /LENGTH=371 /DNA_ID=CAMNT_0006999415 /DNA_START=92 /DNA_END=1204 /DNA_ORIENTATION=-